MQPVEAILNRKIEDPKYISILDEICGLLEECVNYSTHILDECRYKIMEQTKAVDVVTITLFRRYVQLLDSVSVLIKEGCSDSTDSNLRSMFETLLSIAFILKADRLRRALSYEYISYKNQETVLKNIISTSNINESEKVKAQKTLTGIGQKLEDTKYDDIKREWERLRAKGKFNPNWYSLAGVTVNNLSELSKHLGMDNIYREFYKSFSESAHVTNTLEDIRVVDGQELILPLRTPSELQNNAFLSVVLTLRILRMIIQNYLPEKFSNHQNWYSENIAQKVKLLFASGKLINVNLVELTD